MTIEQMKERLIEVYPGELWRKRVERMRPAQIVSVFKTFEINGKFK